MINVTVHTHIKDNTPANARLNAIWFGLKHQRDVRVTKMRRTEIDRGADLIIVKGMSASLPLRYAVDEGIPFIILEEPYWRPNKEYTLSHTSWGYNGMCGRAWYPTTPFGSRPKPPLQPIKTEGDVIIFGQKPDDYSLRGQDHIQWLEQKMKEYPDAELRHHPLMLSNKTPDESIEDCLKRCYRAVTYSSTVGAEALIAGCLSNPECPGSSAYGVHNREAWLHNLSWRQFSNNELTGTPAIKFILSGYDEARWRASEGMIEHPRDKVNRGVNERRYQERFGIT